MASLPEEYEACALSRECPMAEAPGCFRRTLIKALQRGESSGYIPTGLDGFIDSFCRGCRVGTSAEEIVNHWIRDHSGIAVIGAVIKFAKEVGNKMLSDAFNQLLRDHVVENHICQLGNPAQCLKNCCKCCGVEACSTTPPDLSPSPSGSTSSDYTPPMEGLSPSPSGLMPTTQRLEHQSEPVESTITPDQTSPSMTTRRRIHSQETDREESNGQFKCDLHKDSFEYLGKESFNTWPYYYFKKYYHKHTLKLLCLVLFAYHSLAMTLVTMCEDGGFQSVFDEEETMYYEALHRILMFLLRVFARVIIPAVCLVQFASIVADVRVPDSGLSGDRAIQKLMKAHKMFSPRDEMVEIQQKIDGKDYVGAFEQSLGMVQRDSKSMWTILVHSILFIGLLFYLGAFFLTEEKILMGGVCNLKFLNATRLALPMVNIQVLLLLLLECASIFFTVLLIGVIKEFYTYENKIAIYAIAIGDDMAKLYKEVRRRWRAIDYLCYAIPMALAGFVMISFATGKAFTPEPPQKLKYADLATWYFWVFVLSVLTFLASSTNRTINQSCIIGHIFAILYICTSQAIEELTITPAGASIIVLLFTTVAVLAFNLLFSLCRCHFFHWREKHDRYSGLSMFYCGLCMCILPLLGIATAWREVAHLAQFIER